MTWQVIVFVGLAATVAGGFAWYERARPPARLVALVAALAALAIAGRLALAPIPNVVATTDIALITGYSLGGPPGFVVGALVAPISNIWLGQGPWTAWQMAGWGLIGLGGAWLAVVTGRRLGRWGLAIACAVAGLAYGALLDLSVMVTYGGEQSLDRYLALAARGIPFNIVHAVGNFAIALVAGPALVRMISRYRTRLEFRWHPAGALPLALCAVAVGAITPTAPADASGADDAARWLARAQNTDGGFGATPDSPSHPAITGWAMLGLEAAGRNPLDVRSGGGSAVSYLRSEVERLRSAGDLERTILALEGAGLESRRFAGVDLVAELRSRRDRDGSVSGQVNLTAFFVVALRAAGAEAGDLERPVRWLSRSQNDDGGWGYRRATPSDPDSTGAVLQALAAVGGQRSAAADGVRWLRRAQHRDGGYSLAGSGAVNAQSTAWAAQGMIAAGGGGGAVGRALGHLDRLRAADGHYRYSRSSDQTPVWVTAQVLLAVERRPFPVPAVAHEPRVADPARSGSGPTAAPAPAPAPPSAPGLSGPVVTGGGGGLAQIVDRFGGSGGDSGPGAKAAGGNEGGLGGAEEGGGGDRETGLAARDGAGGGGQGGEGSALAPDPVDPGVLTSEPPVTPYVAAGLGLLAIGLGAGFVWYRERLP